MKILVIGGGGREHAIVWKLAQSRFVEKIYCAPGNAGISQLAECIAIADTDIRNLISFVEKTGIDFTLVGPENPLSEGIVDQFTNRKHLIFGPTQAAAKIESSKIFAKEFMKRFHIPTASYVTFDKAEDAVKFIENHKLPIVIKADGLAGGKGATVAETLDEAKEAILKCMIECAYGDAGKRVLVEEFIKGREVSVLAFCDGKTAVPMLTSTDFKRALDGGAGPNTGGMGTVAPNPNIEKNTLNRIINEVVQPTVDGLRYLKTPFKGILYAGVMLVEDEFKVLEFNCRFGDPETQVLLPLLETDLMEILLYIANERLDEAEIIWKNEMSAVCVVMASGGYPKRYRKGFPIEGLEQVKDPQTMVFHAGTTFTGGKVVTDGGRVLGITAWDNDLPKARDRAYRAVGKITFEKEFHRNDIGERFVKERFW